MSLQVRAMNESSIGGLINEFNEDSGHKNVPSYSMLRVDLPLQKKKKRSIIDTEEDNSESEESEESDTESENKKSSGGNNIKTKTKTPEQKTRENINRQKHKNARLASLDASIEPVTKRKWFSSLSPEQKEERNAGRRERNKKRQIWLENSSSHCGQNVETEVSSSSVSANRQSNLHDGTSVFSGLRSTTSQITEACGISSSSGHRGQNVETVVSSSSVSANSNLQDGKKEALINKDAIQFSTEFDRERNFVLCAVCGEEDSLVYMQMIDDKLRAVILKTNLS